MVSQPSVTSPDEALDTAMAHVLAGKALSQPETMGKSMGNPWENGCEPENSGLVVEKTLAEKYAKSPVGMII